MEQMSIRRKISLLLGLLALVMLFQSLERVLHLNASARSFQALSLRVEQTLDDIEILSRATDQLESLSRDIATARTTDDIRRQEAALDEIVQETRQAAQALGKTTAASFDIGGQLDRVSSGVEQLIARRSEVLRLAAENDQVRAQLYADAQALRARILPFRVRLLSGVTQEGGASISESLRLLLTLSGLLVRIDDLLATEAVEQTVTIEADVARLISSAVILLATLSPALSVEGFAEDLARIHAGLTEEMGLATIGAALRDALAEEAAAASILRASMYDISGDLSGLVGQSEQEIGRVYAEAALSAERRIWSEVLVNAGLGLGIVVAVWIVFARQISARLERLTASVLRLASGDLSPVYKSEGNDELSHMTQALEGFRQTARELRRSNDDLANFAYAASHDLRTPLRAIRDLVDWTIEDQGDTLHPDVSRNLDLIRTRADRLSRLLQDLLDYARAGQTKAQAAPVDVAAMLEDVGDLVGVGDGVAIEFRGARIVQTDATPLHTILLNLISNAAKHRDREKVTVTVSVDRTEDGWDLRIQDDGPGIPIRYQTQVFELFKTLKSRDDVEGSGLGLAMVDKLARHLEGSVRVESNPDVRRGTAFIVHIPAPDMSFDRNNETEGAAA